MVKRNLRRDIPPYADPYAGGFSKGFCLLRIREAKEVRDEIIEALGISKNNKMTWADYLHGKRPIYSKDGAVITAIFGNHGIKAEDVWGTDETIKNVQIRW